MDEKVITLPRGGFLAKTKNCYLQVGAPPETIKDTMLLPQSVPQIFILPSKLFSAEKGISLAELEFPIFYNFFLKKRKTFIIGQVEQAERIKRVLLESVYGPADFDINDDIHASFSLGYLLDLKAEMWYYRSFDLEDLVSFIYFSENKAKIEELEIFFDEETDLFIFKEDGQELAWVKASIEYKAQFEIGERLKKPYRPPLFAITCLGPSHGFDVEDNTSGFIVWCNHRGIMIDPPVNSTEWLNSSNVNPKLIDSIILTHCHADHDAGTFQKIMEEGKVTIYTTNTILASFLRKYSALCGEDETYLRRLFDFQPIYIKKPFYIHGAELSCFYSLHSIPTIGLTMNFQGKSFVYSSDHQADPKVHEELYQKGVLTKERYLEFKNFPWDSTFIYHEAGIPPLHTPIKWLASLPKDIQKRIYVYHIAKKDFMANSHLNLCKFGMENTLNISVSSPPFEETYEVLSILKHLDFFHSFSIQKVQEFMLAIERQTFKKGEVIIKQGEKGTKFYIIYAGNVLVSLDGLEVKKRYSEFEYFGEVALMSNKPTTADVIAETEVIVYSMAKEKFLQFISQTEFEETLKKLIKNRDQESWNILSASKHFRSLTSYQKTWLESVLNRVELNGSGFLIRKGEQLEKFYIIRSGQIKILKEAKIIATLGRGDFIGELQAIEKPVFCNWDFYHEADISLFVINKKDLADFIIRNPGLLLKFKLDFFCKGV